MAHICEHCDRSYHPSKYRLFVQSLGAETVNSECYNVDATKMLAELRQRKMFATGAGVMRFMSSSYPTRAVRAGYKVISDFGVHTYIYKTYYTGQREIWRDISRVAVLSRAEGEWKYKVRVKWLHISQWPSVIYCLLHTLLAQLNAYQVFHWVFQPFQPFQWR